MKKNILIVDDEVDILDIIGPFLTQEGFKVLTATGGKKAIDILKKRGKKIDLVILDKMMPDMDGLDVLKEMRRMGVKAKVVILSGSLEIEEHFEELKKLGYADIDLLLKPTDLYRLLEVVRKNLTE